MKQVLSIGFIVIILAMIFHPIDSMKLKPSRAPVTALTITTTFKPSTYSESSRPKLSKSVKSTTTLHPVSSSTTISSSASPTPKLKARQPTKTSHPASKPPRSSVKAKSKSKRANEPYHSARAEF